MREDLGSQDRTRVARWELEAGEWREQPARQASMAGAPF